MSNPFSATNSHVLKNVAFVGCETTENILSSGSGSQFAAQVLPQNQLINLARQKHLDTFVAIVLGPEVNKPVQLCQLLGRANQELPIIIIRTEIDIVAITHRLRMFPGIGRRVQVVLANRDDDIAEHLSIFIQQYTKFIKHQHNLYQARQQTRSLRFKNAGAESYLGTLLETLPVGVVIVDSTGSIESINPWGRKFLGLDYSRNIRKPFHRFFPVKIAADIRNRIQSCLLDLEKINSHPFSLHDGNCTQYYLLSCAPFDVANGDLKLLCIIQDVTAYTTVQMRLAKSQQEFNQIVNTIDDVFWICSSDYSSIHYISPAFQKIWGMDENYFIRHPKRLLVTVAPEDRHAFIHKLTDVDIQESHDIEFRILRPDGGVRWLLTRKSLVVDEAYGTAKIAGIAHDITERKRTEQKILQLSTVDALTGLQNRADFSRCLERELANHRGNDYLLALLYLDLDEFKTVNDSLGHGTGDQLIVSLAQRLSNVLRREDIISRFGGDEFVILIKVQIIHEITNIVGKLLKECSQPFALGYYQVSVSASIGIAVADVSGMSAARLIQNADTAMYEAKRAGRNNYAYFNNEMNRVALNRLTVESRLRQSLENSELLVLYQPIFDLATKELKSMETLVRFSDPALGEMGTGEVIKLAEETGFIIALGKQIFCAVCAQLKRWESAELLHCLESVAVNISSKQLNQDNFVSWLADTLNHYAFSPGFFDLELTESAIMHDINEEFKVLYTLHNQGFRISIDDFGTGYSSFGRLKSLPVDTLKIDRSFVMDIVENENDLAICRGIIKMAHELGLKVIAEGIETASQLSLLQSFQCDRAQGYWLSEPLDAKRMTTFLKKAKLHR